MWCVFWVGLNKLKLTLHESCNILSHNMHITPAGMCWNVPPQHTDIYRSVAIYPHTHRYYSLTVYSKDHRQPWFEHLNICWACHALLLSTDNMHHQTKFRLPPVRTMTLWIQYNYQQLCYDVFWDFEELSQHICLRRFVWIRMFSSLKKR